MGRERGGGKEGKERGRGKEGKERGRGKGGQERGGGKRMLKGTNRGQRGVVSGTYICKYILY